VERAVQDWGVQVTAAQQGDLTAFTAVVRRFEDMAVGYAYSLLGDREAAQDAAQEAFIEAYLCLKGLRTAHAFPAWLRRIVLKQCDRITRKAALPTVPLESAAEVPAREAGPAETLEREEVRRTVLSAVRSLPEHERTTTTLFYINGYSLTEIGDFLEVPVGTVKRRLHSARQKLRERMVDLVEESLKQQAPDKEFASRVRRVLEGVARIHWTETSCLCFVGSVLASMRYLGDELEKDYVMGVSGGAFKMFWIPPWSPANCDLLDIGEEPVRRTFAALGYDYTYLGNYRRDNPAYTKEFLQSRIVASIDAGRPVIAMGIVGPPEACVIAGYDKGGDVLYGRSYFQGDPGHGDAEYTVEASGYFRTDDWYPHCAGLILIGEKRATPSPRQVLRGALEWAIDLARVSERATRLGKDPNESENHPSVYPEKLYSGLAAYDQMAAGLERDEDFPVDNTDLLKFRLYAIANDGIFLMECKRGAAARFCESQAALGLPGAEALRKAAERYRREAQIWQRARKMVPWSGSPPGHVRKIADAKLRREVAALVREAKGVEEQAVARVEEARKAVGA
jgi:RNA polymerase sigma factor (sigma-70 family)